MRKCVICGTTEQLEESHDVPCYLFIDFERRLNKKNEADKYGRHLLCKDHHKEYERNLNNQLILIARIFANKYFKEEDDSISKI